MQIKKDLMSVIAAALLELKEQGYSNNRIIDHRQKYNGLIKYCTANAIDEYTETVGQQYLEYIAQTRKLQTRDAINFFAIAIRRLNSALHGVKWQHLEYKCLEYEQSCFSNVVTDYEQYLTSWKRSHIRWQVLTISRFLKEIECLGYNSLKEFNAKSLLEIYTNGKIKEYLFARIIKPFLKYAYKYELTRHNLSLAVPIRSRNVMVPSVYSPMETELLLASIDRAMPIGKRNYAIIIIAARLGIRAGDIAGLKFGNINFVDASIQLTQSKTQKLLKLSMADDVKLALQDYIDNGRPKSQDEHIFLKKYGYGVITGGTVSSMVGDAFINAGINCENKRRGTHALRASLATALLSEGNDYSAVQKVLGHVDIQSSKAYVKTEVEKLRINAIPVPPLSGRFAALLGMKRISI